MQAIFVNYSLVLSWWVVYSYSFMRNATTDIFVEMRDAFLQHHKEQRKSKMLSTKIADMKLHIDGASTVRNSAQPDRKLIVSILISNFYTLLAGTTKTAANNVSVPRFPPPYFIISTEFISFVFYISELFLDSRMHEKKWKIDIERFRIQREKLEYVKDAEPLGKGATAVVVPATIYGQCVAVKMPNVQKSQPFSSLSCNHQEQVEEISRALLHELSICAPLCHPNVVETIGLASRKKCLHHTSSFTLLMLNLLLVRHGSGCWNNDGTDVCIIFELAPRGSMKDYLERGTSVTLSMLSVTRLFATIFSPGFVI